MESTTRPEPAPDRALDRTPARAPDRELSREELVAELERVVSQAKTDSKRWEPLAAAVTDDLLPNRRR